MYVTLETIEFKHLILLVLPNSSVSSLFHFVLFLLLCNTNSCYYSQGVKRRPPAVTRLPAQTTHKRFFIHCDFKNLSIQMVWLDVLIHSHCVAQYKFNLRGVRMWLVALADQEGVRQSEIMICMALHVTHRSRDKCSHMRTCQWFKYGLFVIVWHTGVVGVSSHIFRPLVALCLRLHDSWIGCSELLYTRWCD